MKNRNSLQKSLMYSTLALAVAAVAWLPGTVSAQEANAGMKPMKGGEHLMMLNRPITTAEDANALTPDDSIAMVCPKCKSVTVQFVTKNSKGKVTGMTPGEKHLCPGCGGIWTVTGVGKGEQMVLQHTCSACGEGAFCCATTTNAPPTTGMETPDTDAK